MSQLKPNLLLKQPTPLIQEDDENRIDWNRKSLRKKREDEIETVDDDHDVLILVRPKKEKHSKKRRHLVMDEESGRMIVKRLRKRSRYDEWLEDNYD